VYARFAGKLTTADSARYADALRKHPGFKESWSEIVDLRPVEDFQITPDETIALADTIDPFSLSSRRAAPRCFRSRSDLRHSHICNSASRATYTIFPNHNDLASPLVFALSFCASFAHLAPYIR
jgi:hypothetical protein